MSQDDSLKLLFSGEKSFLKKVKTFEILLNSGFSKKLSFYTSILFQNYWKIEKRIIKFFWIY